jgi:hypothetical protein
VRTRTLAVLGDAIRRCAVSILAFGVPRSIAEVDVIADELSDISRYSAINRLSATLKDDSTESSKLDILSIGKYHRQPNELDGPWDDPCWCRDKDNSLWQQLAVHQQCISTGTGTSKKMDNTPNECLDVAATKRAVPISLGIESMAKDVAHFLVETC